MWFVRIAEDTGMHGCKRVWCLGFDLVIVYVISVSLSGGSTPLIPTTIPKRGESDF